MGLWTNEEKVALRELVDQGASGSMAAEQLSARFGRLFTRSATVKAAYRIGHRFASERRGCQRKAKPKALKPSVKREQQPCSCTIWELTRERCHYPLWPDAQRANPKSPYCGARTDYPPYCEHHSKVAFRPSNRRDPSSSLMTVKVWVNPLKLITL